MENKDAILIRKYMTLMESIDKKIESKTEEPLDEQVAMIRDLVKVLGREVGVEKALWQTLKTEIPMIGNRFKTAAEFKAAAEAGKITAAESSELVKYAIKNVPEVAIKMKGMLRTTPEFAEIAKQVYPKGTQMAADVKKLELAQKTMATFGIEAKEAEAMLKKAAQEAGGTAGVTTRSVNKAIEKRGAQAAKTGTGAAKDAVKTAEQTKKITDGVKQIQSGGNKFQWFINIWNRFGKETKPIIENGVKKFTVSKKLLQWALLAGGGYLLYSLLTDSDGSDVVVQDENGQVVDPNLTNGLADCLRKLIENKTGEIAQTSSGDPVVFVAKTGNPEYDNAGGLKFYLNGRVFTDDNSKRGSWKCKAGQIQTVNESFFLNEQSDAELANDVEIMIDLLDFPVSGSDLQQANALLTKYANGSRGKDFLELYQNSGLGSGSLSKSLDYIATFKAASVQSKQNMYKLIKQIESGKTGGGDVPTGGGNADLSGIDITWDGSKEVTPTPVDPDKDPTPTPPKPQNYVDCNDLPFKFGCRNAKIKEVQKCLGLESKFQTGNFGPLTLSKLRNQYGTDVIDTTTYDTIMKNCKKVAQTGTTVNTGTTVVTTGTTITPPKPSGETPPKPSGETPTPVKPEVSLTRRTCKALFDTINDRDQAAGKATATDKEIQQLKFCMQQYNFGVGSGVNKMKRRYGLTASGGDRGIR